MDRLQNIVIGVDFSEFSQVALAQARRIARWNQSDLHFVHVVDELVVKELHKAMSHSPEKITQDILQTTQKKIDKLFAEDPLERRKDQPGSGGTEYDDRRVNDQRRIELKPEVVVGTPFEELLRQVKDANTDLLMLGSNGMNKPVGGLGDLATKCVRKAECRVMIVRESHAKPFTGIVACVDFSSTSPQVVEQAIRVARQDKAKLHVVHAFSPPWDVLHYKSPTAASSPDFQKQYRDNLYAELENYLQKHKEDIEGLDVACQLLESPRPVDSIIEYVGDTGADLVVVGTRGRTGVKALLLSTQAERIVQNTPVSVLVLKPSGFSYDVT